MSNSAPDEVTPQTKTTAKARRAAADRSRRYREQLAQKIRKEALEREKPQPPYVERIGGEVRLTESGVSLIEYLARAHSLPGHIASALGIPRKRLNLIFDRAKGDNPEHLAFERGHFAFQQEVIDRLWAHSERNFIPAIFVAKSIFGMRENAEPTVLNQQQNIVFLPASMTEADYLKSVGLVGAIDTRDPQRRQIISGSESPEAPFGRYADGRPVPDYCGLKGMRMLPPPSNTSQIPREE
jgi:hypothetical protein